MGKLTFPNDYPWKPPAIRLITESGRFRVNDRICLSISDYHPESWNPVWTVGHIIVGLISFFVTEDSTVGSIQKTIEERQEICKSSQKTALKHPIYKKLFTSFSDNIGITTSKPELKPPPPKDLSTDF